MAEIKGYKLDYSVGKSLIQKDCITYREALPRVIKTTSIVSASVQKHLGLSRYTQDKCGYIVPNYYKDLYNQIIVIPHFVALGTIATEQVFKVAVWNAYKHPVKLTSIKLTDAEGIDIIGKKPPYRFQSTALIEWEVRVSMNGPAVIEAVITWEFDRHSPVSLKITGSRSTDWSFFPDWAESVTENLAWLTSVHQSITGAEQRVARRLSPRRTFEFKLSFDKQEKQKFENAMYGFGARVWAMPIFTDRATLSQKTKAGDVTLFLNTAGYDFSENGRVLVSNGKVKEMLEITSIEADFVRLKRPISNAFDITSEVYPLRSAVLTDMPVITKLSDGVSTAQVRLQIHEHNAYSSDITHLPTYRNHPVLEPTSNWSEDITAQYLRLIKTLDNNTGLPYYLDTAKHAFQVIAHHFVAKNREEQRKLRQLFYYLRGRQKAIWVATSSSDIDIVSDIKAKTFQVRNSNFKSTIFDNVGRKDIRIELIDGTIFYRRIKSIAVVNADIEVIGLDTEDLNIKQDDVLKISFLTLSRLENDTISWKHHTDADGVATVTVSFRGLRDELEC